MHAYLLYRVFSWYLIVLTGNIFFLFFCIQSMIGTHVVCTLSACICVYVYIMYVYRKHNMHIFVHACVYHDWKGQVSQVRWLEFHAYKYGFCICIVYICAGLYMCMWLTWSEYACSERGVLQRQSLDLRPRQYPHLECVYTYVCMHGRVSTPRVCIHICMYAWSSIHT
jgi:hypothetical protein